MKAMPKKRISRDRVLQEIFSCFQQMTQWLTIPESYAQYHVKAETLIETVEVFDCGFIGGYDPKNRNKVITGYYLYDRFLTLVRKENTPIKKECHFTVDKMTKFWKKLEGLRESFNT